GIAAVDDQFASPARLDAAGAVVAAAGAELHVERVAGNAGNQCPLVDQRGQVVADRGRLVGSDGPGSVDGDAGVDGERGGRAPLRDGAAGAQVNGAGAGQQLREVAQVHAGAGAAVGRADLLRRVERQTAMEEGARAEGLQV